LGRDDTWGTRTGRRRPRRGLLADAGSCLRWWGGAPEGFPQVAVRLCPIQPRLSTDPATAADRQGRAACGGEGPEVPWVLERAFDSGEGRHPAHACQEDRPITQVPRIRRAEPTEAAVRPIEPLPVTVTLIWHDGATDETPADAVAWTHREVEIEWTTPWGDLRRDWISASQVRRRA